MYHFPKGKGISSEHGIVMVGMEGHDSLPNPIDCDFIGWSFFFLKYIFY